MDVTEFRKAHHSAIGKIALPHAGRAGIQIAGIAGRREIQDPARSHSVDRLSDDPVLEG